MKIDEYNQWIQNFILKLGFVRGMCVHAANEMKQAFPELRIVKGFAVFNEAYESARAEHAWLITEDGTILDPTKGQFDLPFTYREWQPGDRVQVGRCMNCGDDIYDKPKSLDDDSLHRSVCSRNCEIELEFEYNGNSTKFQNF